MSLISREAAIDAIEELKNRYFDRKVVLAKAQDAINNLTSAHPVVRCKDCAYWDGIYCVDFLTTDPEGYCSWAKRKGGER